jgi:hypothetical protein
LVLFVSLAGGTWRGDTILPGPRHFDEGGFLPTLQESKDKNMTPVDVAIMLPLERQTASIDLLRGSGTGKR